MVKLAEETIGVPSQIFVTGDIAFSGGCAIRRDGAPNSEYADALTWLKTVAAALRIPTSRIHCVPGNHDVQRDADKVPAVRRLVQSIRSGAESLDASLEQHDDFTALRGRFSNYLQFVAALQRQDAKDEGLWWTKVFQEARLAVRVVGLNSSLVSSGDDDHGCLRVGTRQLEKLFGNPPSAGELVIVLSHHPFTGGWMADGIDVERWVRNRAHVLLAGHVHEASSVQSRTGSDATFVCISAGASHGPWMATGATPAHGYNVAAIVADGDSLRLRVWPRRWADSIKEFRRDSENVPDGSASADHELPRVRLAILPPSPPSPSATPASSVGSPELTDQSAASVNVWDANPEVAAAALALHVERGGDDPLSHWKLAALLARVGRLAEATERMVLGDSLGHGQPSPPERLLYGGVLSLRLNDLPAAFDQLSKFTALPEISDYELGIAYDMIGTIERRRSNVEAAIDMLRAALETKRRIGDRFGTAVTLGNLGRLLLHKGAAGDAVTALRENLEITRELVDAGKIGLVSNNLAEALTEAGALDEAATLLSEVLHSATSSPVDRGFANCVKAYHCLLSGNLATNLDAARDCSGAARDLFEDSANADGLRLVEELDGLIAICSRWMGTARSRFRSVDDIVAEFDDPIQRVYRLRRRASLAAHVGVRALAMEYTLAARDVARENRLPLLGDLEGDVSRYRKEIDAAPPATGDELRWLRYWRARLPRPLALALPTTLNNPLSVFRFLELATDYVSYIALSMTRLAPPVAQRTRASFGEKVGFLRALLKLLQELQMTIPRQDQLLETLTEAVRQRNKYVHHTGEDGGEGSRILLSQAIDELASLRLFVVSNGDRELAGTLDHVPEGIVTFDIGSRIDAGLVLKVIDGRLAFNAGMLRGGDDWVLETGQRIGHPEPTEPSELRSRPRGEPLVD